jgi:predicted RNA binding protein YcfA (HicA-like mRNA interferase family)
MKMPRDLSGGEPVKALRKVGYEMTRQKGSHIRLTTQRNGEHHLTIPDHDPIKVGTLADILADVGQHLGLDREELLQEMFGKKRK